MLAAFHDHMFKCTVCVANAPCWLRFMITCSNVLYVLPMPHVGCVSGVAEAAQLFHTGGHAWPPLTTNHICASGKHRHHRQYAGDTFHMISYLPHLPSFVSICAGQVIYWAAETKYWFSTTHIENICLSCDQLVPQCLWLSVLWMQHYLYKAALWNI